MKRALSDCLQADAFAQVGGNGVSDERVHEVAPDLAY
ncbi:hypothetical protein PAM7066_00056 [Palleronia marisminoris]|uniref:Uncharacterized protein n=1 Tax=Palleronia marisminoris TaxID=315423 RepID=A0A1Y5R791_9RHOB|nr:hypothetical protein PAM7066_00056 [Palleronia marisminoris]